MQLAVFIQNAADLPMYPRVIFRGCITRDEICFTHERGHEVTIVGMLLDQDRHGLLQLQQDLMKFNAGFQHDHILYDVWVKLPRGDVKLESSGLVQQKTLALFLHETFVFSSHVKMASRFSALFLTVFPRRRLYKLPTAIPRDGERHGQESH